MIDSNQVLRKMFEIEYNIERTQPMGAGGAGATQRAVVIMRDQAITPELYKKMHDLIASTALQGKFNILSIKQYLAGQVYLLEE